MKGIDFMEKIINALIKVDDNCKNELKLVEEKRDNIEYLVDKELTKRKLEIKTRYKFKIDMKKNEYDIKLNKMKEDMEKSTNNQIEQIKNDYITQKDNLINGIIKKIVNL